LQYVNNNAYLVVADEAAGTALANLVATGEPLRYSAPLAAGQKLTPGVSRYLAEQGGTTRYTVVVAQHARDSVSQNLIRGFDASGEKRAWQDLRGMSSIDVDLPAARVADVAALGDVLAIDLATKKKKFDEKQTQIMAGAFNPTQSGPSAPGYRAWLEAQNFSTTPADYPLVAIVDDGVGNGTTTAGAGDANFTANGAGSESRVLFAVSCTNDSPAGIGGHGNINASIAAGYDDRTGFPYRDPDGYRRREGVNPWGRLSNVQIFGDGVSGDCGTGEEGTIALQATQGVKISSNSWGLGSIFGPATGYIAQSRAYDLGVRDADPATAGNQQVAFIFAAGNDGPTASMVSAPGNAKNTLVVGASENQRPSDENGPWNDATCQTGPTDADNAMDVADYSSRGPAVGGRAKPEVIAPGTHIQGGASVAAGFTGGSVCEQYRPSGQTAVSSSTGTSHSTPAVAGAASLVYRYLQTALAQAAPSPALVKSYLIAHPTYLTGVSGNDTLPSAAQGYGMPNLAAAFSATPARVIVDQTQTFGATGDTYALIGAVADNTKPVRVVLSWTDAPAAVNSTSPAVNNLDLVVTVGGVAYRGNRFAGQWSTTGGSADTANNTEVVFLPPGTSGSLRVDVVGTNIAGDGVPGNADTTDQDFALVCNNCSQQPDFYIASTANVQEACGLDAAQWPLDVGAISGYTGSVALAASGVPANATPAFGQASGNAPFSTTFSVTPTAPLTDGDHAITISGTDATHTNTGVLTLRYSAAAAAAPSLTAPANGATSVTTSPTLTWAASAGAVDYTVEIDDDPAFGSIDRTATVAGTSYTVTAALTGATQYYWRVRANNHCGAGANPPNAFSFTTQALFCATVGTPIPDNSATGVTVQIVVPPMGTLADLDVSFATNHTWAGDLTVRLTKDAVVANLMDRPGVTTSGSGCQGNNADLIFDDEGTAGSVESSCSNGDPAYAPPGGRYTPNQPLSAFDGVEAGGTYSVFLSDSASQDSGVIQNLCLIPTIQADAIFANGFETPTP
ncbi:MAG TPA: S8 family serine peptidase, partial [Tahibacter sp.]|nr:S8 family serine peptidase [Tahibacter sp.]